MNQVTKRDGCLELRICLAKDIRVTPKKKWSVYILRCSDDSLYTGITTDIEARLDKHNKGQGAKYTRSRRPVEMAWHKKAKTESAARKREAEIKGWSREEKLRLIEKSKQGL